MGKGGALCRGVCVCGGGLYVGMCVCGALCRCLWGLHVVCGALWGGGGEILCRCVCGDFM